MRVLFLIVMFLFIGAFFLVSENNIKMNSSENVAGFFTLYAGWIDNLILNGGSVAGYVVKMEWLPNSTAK